MSKTLLENTVIIVPICVDALVLLQDEMALEAMADFTKLPYSDSEQDYNPGIANISENILSPPFGNENLQLRKGIHLHWALPDALTKGQTGSNINTGSTVNTSIAANGYYKVPNRWLVSKYKNSQLVSQNIVESDFVHEPTNDLDVGLVTIPSAALSQAQNTSAQRYRHLGNNFPYTSWLNDASSSNSWADLTALGYGEPAFAAFYPNCHSVFGYYDNGIDTANVQYEVIGWYSQAKNDPLSVFVKNSNETGVKLLEAIEKEFNWSYEGASITSDEPRQTICYGTVTPVNPKSGSAKPQHEVKVALADNPTSALASLLASTLSVPDIAQFEEQLEAIQLSHKLNHASPDFGSKLMEARHAKGFAALKGGSNWTLKFLTKSESIKKKPTVESGDSTTPKDELLELPSVLAKPLSDLNQAQLAYDQSKSRLDSMQHQLFSDWYKYMICSYPHMGNEDDYPNADLVRFFLHQETTGAIDSLNNELGELTISTGNYNELAGLNCSGSGEDARQLITASKKLIASVQQWNAEHPEQRPILIKQTVLDHYLRPNDPVMMFMGETLSANKRNGQDGRLTCLVTSLNGASLKSQISNLQAFMSKHAEFGSNDAIKPPFHPLFFEWQVHFQPTTESNAAHTNNPEQVSGDKGQKSETYSSDYITTNYTLQSGKVDLSPNTSNDFVQNTNVYTGRSYINAKAGKDQLLAKLEQYIEQWVLPTYHGTSSGETMSTSDVLNESLPDILTWAKTQYPGKYTQMPYAALRAYSTLKTAHPLSQALSGLTDAFLMHKLTLQLAIADPLGFSNDQGFAGIVAKVVGNKVRSAPQPEVDFNPIRTGLLNISALQVVDTFGLAHSLDPTWVGTASLPYSSGPEKSGYNLPPRISQPTRISCHWMAANADEVVSNDHPATSPICGWLVPNNLDNSLMVYDSNGNSLGAITTNTAQAWQPNPGDAVPLSVIQIENLHLQNVVQFIINQGEAYLQDFLTAVDSGLQNCQPESYAQHLSLALFMGRPIAVTRIGISLNPLGALATDQSWDAFRYALQHGERNTHGFEQVQMPVRIGEFAQLNDGVIGFWQEPFMNGENTTFCAIQSSQPITTEGTGSSSAAKIESHDADSVKVKVSLSSPTQYLTVLFDPRGKLHVTSGILPTKVLEVPPFQYSDALQKIQVGFLTSPVLTGEDIGLPLPAEPGYSWSFNQRLNDGTWKQLARQGTIGYDQVIKSFDNGPALWSQMIKSNWIQIDNSARQLSAKIVPKDQRKHTNLGVLDPVCQTVESWLDEFYLSGVDDKARFLPGIQIREGWLKLSPEVTLTQATPDDIGTLANVNTTDKTKNTPSNNGDTTTKTTNTNS